MKIFIKVLSAIILAAVVALCVCIRLASFDDNTDKYTIAAADEKAVQKIALNAVLLNQYDITEEQFNSLLAYLISVVNKTADENDDRVLAAYFDVDQPSCSRLYLQAKLGKRNYGLWADLEQQFDKDNKQLKLIISNAHIGRLKIPQSILVHELKKIDLDVVGDYVSFNKNAICVSTIFTYKIPVVEYEVTADIEGVTIADEKVRIETNPILGDAANDLKKAMGNDLLNFIIDYIPDDLGEYFGGLFGTE